MRDYLGFVIAEATKRHEAGLDADAAIASIDLGKYAGMPNPRDPGTECHRGLPRPRPGAAAAALDEIFGKIADLEGFTGDAGLSAATAGEN